MYELITQEESARRQARQEEMAKEPCPFAHLPKRWFIGGKTPEGKPITISISDKTYKKLQELAKNRDH